MTDIDLFSAYTPMGLVKAEAGATDEPEPMTGRIGGIISAETRDQQGEEILQDGVDWSYFLQKGWFNYEHAQGPDNILGYPERVTSDGGDGESVTRVEGVLVLAKAKAREVWETANALAKAGGDRQLGFSVEGQVVAREGKRIVKSRVLNVAITAHPVHPDARLEVLARSLMAAEALDGLRKNTTVGYQSPASAGTGLGAIIPQSLEGSPSSETYGPEIMRRVHWLKHFSDEEFTAMLAMQRFPGMTYQRALEAAPHIKRAAKR